MNRYSVLLSTAILAITIAVSAAAQDTGGIRGAVVDKDGEPLWGATVTVTNTGLSIVIDGVTDARGEVRFDSLPPGKGYSVVVSFPALSKIMVPDIEVPTNKLIAVPVSLRPRGEMVGCRFPAFGMETPAIETPAPESVPRVGGITGAVVDKAGQPIVGVTVSVTNPSLGITTGGLTDARGEFRIAPLPPDKGYTLSVSVPAMERISMPGFEVPANRMRAIPITVRPAGDATPGHS